MNQSEMQKEFEEFTKKTTPQFTAVGVGFEAITRAIGVLGLSILSLDRTSSRLARIYIWLTAVLAVIGIVQIILMLRGH